MRGFRFWLMTKFVDCEKWFKTHVIREMCQKLHAKLDRDTPPPGYPLMNDVTMIKINSSSLFPQVD